MIRSERILTGYDDRKKRPMKPSDIAARLKVKQRKTSTDAPESQNVSRTSRHGAGKAR